ncbi:hypothetical protein BDQ12DRAFT_653349 [Crucibulum laeve]|uniref:AB hydrolase-1 domain-containing protein n=1 Tax=Crucibulum laeve TaxID=68775 RepID=A0A5C3LW82_9AGAR|nr:hypothetical protein BDQ12DRAFT_653349 [Crucibulum laeve]
MPTIQVKDLEFFYTDSGAPNAAVYRTIIIIHGHTFHSGTFQRLLPLAAAQSLRVICVNRREYPGTTPFTPEELKVFAEGSEKERALLIEQQGIDLGLFVDAVIQQLVLSKEGGITLAAWSLGNAFLISLLASINLLPVESKERLQTYVKTVILWDPPTQALGIKSPPGSYVPLWDETLAPEARGPAFGVWAASYWKHGDISSRNFDQFEHRIPDPSKKPSTDNMTREELFSLADFAPGGKCETILCEPAFANVLMNQTQKALFAPEVRKSWYGAEFWNMYGDSNPWNIIYSPWILEQKVKAAKTVQPLLKFKANEGANHFLMWDEPEKALRAIQDCSR